MTVARSVADVLSEHVSFEVECIDRMYLNVYQPRLQYAAGLVGYVHRRLGLPIASTAPLAKITDRFVAGVHRFAETEGIPWVDFKKGQRKDDVMAQLLTSFTAEEGVVFIGRAQEKTPLFRTEKRRHADGVAYPWIVKTTGVVNHFYFYCVDTDFGPFFLKFCSYFPYNAKLCINGNHWARRQAAKAGIGFTPMDNAFAAVDDVAGLQRNCDQLGPEWSLRFQLRRSASNRRSRGVLDAGTSGEKVMMRWDSEFAAFVEQGVPALHRAAWLLTGDRDGAADLVQETLTRLYPKWDQVLHSDSPSAYVRKAMLRRFLSTRRLRSAGEIPTSRFADHGEHVADEDQTVTRVFLHRQLAQLPRSQRAALVLRFYLDLRDEDAARAMNCPVSTFRSHARRGLAALRQQLTEIPDRAVIAPPMNSEPTI